MFATHSRTQVTRSSMRPVFSGLKIARPRNMALMDFFWLSESFLAMVSSPFSKPEIAFQSKSFALCIVSYFLASTAIQGLAG